MVCPGCMDKCPECGKERCPCYEEECYCEIDKRKYAPVGNPEE